MRATSFLELRKWLGASSSAVVPTASLITSPSSTFHGVRDPPQPSAAMTCVDIKPKVRTALKMVRDVVMA